MINIARVLVGLVGLLSLLTAASLWFNLDSAVAQLGISPNGGIGRATVRADVAGLFLGIAVFAIMAAWKQNRAYAYGALILGTCALAGRLFSLLADGAHAGAFGPIVIEVICLAIFAWARSVWKPSA